MEISDQTRLWRLIEASEGRKPQAYRDTKGFLTIGVGRNLETVGLSDSEQDYLLANDISRASRYLNSFNWFSGLNPPRKAALIDMVFNLGPKGFGQFAAMCSALTKGDFEVAAREALASEWARQVGHRAVRDAHMIETGLWCD